MGTEKAPLSWVMGNGAGNRGVRWEEITSEKK